MTFVVITATFFMYVKMVYLQEFKPVLIDSYTYITDISGIAVVCTEQSVLLNVLLICISCEKPKVRLYCEYKNNIGFFCQCTWMLYNNSYISVILQL